MSDELAQQIPYPALGDLVQWLEAENVPYTVIGGLSVSIVSQPRPTIDIDLVVWLDRERWPTFLESAKQYGIQPRTEDALEFARQRRVLYCWNTASRASVLTFLLALCHLKMR